jgi:hypothetical protein
MNDCCDKLKNCFPEPLERLDQLKSRLELIRVWELRFIVYYRCRQCGQLWEEHNEPFNRMEMYSVLKSFPDESGNPREVYYDFHTDEITFRDTGEKISLRWKEPEEAGCLLSWLM